MKTYNLMITANVGDDAMCIYSKRWTKNPLLKSMDRPVWTYVLGVLPAFEWIEDDGEDTYDSEYLQLVHYPKGEPAENYLLVSWHVTEGE